MARHFPNFIEAYVSHVKDDFVPEKFHYWMAMSAISGAVERKVKLQWSRSVVFYANLYLMLVAKPGIGKTTAINPVVNLLKGLEAYGQVVNVLPDQMTEAKFISLMSRQQTYEIGTKIHYQSAGYFAAREASNSLKNVYGGFLECLTDFYDCPTKWSRATMKSDEATIINGCMNMVAGCTFDYLNKLVTTESIHSGFASRFIYVIQDEDFIRKSPWPTDDVMLDSATNEKLVEDLAQIGKLAGSFRASMEFQEIWSTWFPKFDAHRQSLPSEAMQSLLVRKSTNLLKLCMIFSLSEGNSLMLMPNHWEQAIKLLDAMELELPAMITRANSAQVDTQVGLNAAIKLELESKKIGLRELRGKLSARNFKPNEVNSTIEQMLNAGVITADGSGLLKFTAEA